MVRNAVLADEEPQPVLFDFELGKLVLLYERQNLSQVIQIHELVEFEDLRI